MTITELGSIGEFLAAIATVITLIYLATQVRQNTRALKSATFQSITGEMGRNVEPISVSADLAGIMTRGMPQPDQLSPEETLRLASVYVATFRRMESVFVQNQLGSIDDALMKGFETSIALLLNSPFGSFWWSTAKVTFYAPFVEHIEKCAARLADDSPHHPSMMIVQRAAD